MIEKMTRMKQAACPDGIPPDDMEEGVGEKKHDKNEKIDDRKEAECPDGTPHDDMEEGVSEIKDDKNERIDEEKESEFPDVTPPESTTMDEGKGTKNEKGYEDVDLDELYESTYYDDKDHDIFDNQEENIIIFVIITSGFI